MYVFDVYNVKLVNILRQTVIACTNALVRPSKSNVTLLLSWEVVITTCILVTLVCASQKCFLIFHFNYYFKINCEVHLIRKPNYSPLPESVFVNWQLFEHQNCLLHHVWCIFCSTGLYLLDYERLLAWLNVRLNVFVGAHSCEMYLDDASLLAVWCATH